MSKKNKDLPNIQKMNAAAIEEAKWKAGRLRMLLSGAGFVLLISGGFWICAFKIFSNDFWFHIKMGEIISRTGSLIRFEDFSYILAGRPILTHYEYLSQILFYQVFHLAGATGFIMFRSLLVLGMGLLLLSIDKRNAWPNVLCVIWALVLSRGGFIDRPQLFSFLFYLGSLRLVLAYLSSPELGSGVFRQRIKILGGLAALQVVWVNFHGGANLMGFVPYAALCGERFWIWLFEEGRERVGENREPLYLLAGGAAMVAGSLATPDTYRGYAFLFKLLGDSSNALIKEWQPRPWEDYLKELGPFWLLAGLAFASARKNSVFSALLLIVMGYASHKLYRLGVTFTFTACGIAIHQLKNCGTWNRFLDEQARRPRAFLVSAALLLAVEGILIERRNIGELQANGLAGYGVSDYAARAVDFLEEENITGRMFNNFDLGAYLIYRGAPDRKVFIDGRNADYGEDFVRKAILAANNASLWQQLDSRYNFTYAVVDYLGVDGKDLAFISHLDQNPAWVPVYFDDRVAVYVKDIPENKAVINKCAYRMISPSRVEFGYGTLFNGLNAEDSEKAEKELERLIESGPGVIKGRLILAMRCIQTKRYDHAIQLAEEITSLKPDMVEPYEILGMAYAAQNSWPLAAQAFDRAVKLTPKERASRLNYNYLAQVFENAGDFGKARQYQRKALRINRF